MGVCVSISVTSVVVVVAVVTVANLSLFASLVFYYMCIVAAV